MFYRLIVIFLAVILCSCAASNIESIKDAEKSGISLDHKDIFGNTPLMRAAYIGDAEAVEYLCSKGADVNIQNPRGDTALLNAAYYNHVEIAKILLKYNADTTIRNRQGFTALDAAWLNLNYENSDWSRSYKDLVDLLKEYKHRK